MDYRNFVLLLVLTAVYYRVSELSNNHKTRKKVPVLDYKFLDKLNVGGNEKIAGQTL